jgi:hypothetical protein
MTSGRTTGGGSDEGDDKQHGRHRSMYGVFRLGQVRNFAKVCPPMIEAFLEFVQRDLSSSLCAVAQSFNVIERLWGFAKETIDSRNELELFQPACDRRPHRGAQRGDAARRRFRFDSN